MTIRSRIKGEFFFCPDVKDGVFNVCAIMPNFKVDLHFFILHSICLVFLVNLKYWLLLSYAKNFTFDNSQHKTKDSV